MASQPPSPLRGCKACGALDPMRGRAPPTHSRPSQKRWACRRPLAWSTRSPCICGDPLQGGLTLVASPSLLQARYLLFLHKHCVLSLHCICFAGLLSTFIFLSLLSQGECQFHPCLNLFTPHAQHLGHCLVLSKHLVNTDRREGGAGGSSKLIDAAQ